MHITLDDISPGDIIDYVALGGETRRARVTAVVPDVKNGQPGFDAYLAVDQTPVWGYLSQITRHVKVG